MNGFKSRREVESIKEQYPVGTRIELIAVYLGWLLGAEIQRIKNSLDPC